MARWKEDVGTALMDTLEVKDSGGRRRRMRFRLSLSKAMVPTRPDATNEWVIEMMGKRREAGAKAKVLTVRRTSLLYIRTNRKRPHIFLLKLPWVSKL